MAPIALHVVKQLQGQLPAPALLTGIDEGAVGDDIALAAMRNHVLEDLEGLVHLQAVQLTSSRNLSDSCVGLTAGSQSG